MPRKERKRISYVLPLAKSAGGHRLGVNGLAVDAHNSILYSGGRDGVICAWNLNLSLNPFADPISSTDDDSELDNEEKTQSTTFRQQVQAHSHWVNDIVLTASNTALVSASSDITVKVWRPFAENVLPPQTIGEHSDYVKCLASPGPQSSWVASGGLDRKICLWDLTVGGAKLKLTVGEDDLDSLGKEKGSVYALAATSNILASGGPENIVRMWDPRSGKRITKFVGHTDNIRDVLISQDGDTVMSASSDQTVKVWSMTAGRCMNTLTMHNDSVWSLYSSHPRLSVFYSSDRSGLVAKTDARGAAEIDEGLSVALCREHSGVNTVIHAGDFVWTSTSSSSINRWRDVDTEEALQTREIFYARTHRLSVATTRTRGSVSRPDSTLQGASPGPTVQIPPAAFLRTSNAAAFTFIPSRDPDAATLASRKGSESLLSHEQPGIKPVRSLPDYSIEGQNGLIKHILLNDRRRVLTLDTAGEVMMWDLLQCQPVKTYGKRHLEDVVPEVNTTETVAHWCAVDTRTGSLTCVLEENYCFDAEVYADELKFDEHIDFREDQRINLGKWVLRYLFANLIDEEIRRDEAFRKQLIVAETETVAKGTLLGKLQMPPRGLPTWPEDGTTPVADMTKSSNGLRPVTPGMGIGLATPAITTSLQGRGSIDAARSPGIAGQPVTTPAGERSNDYFTGNHTAAPQKDAQTPTTPGAAQVAADLKEEENAQSTTDLKKKTTAFGKKFKMDMTFGMKKLTRNNNTEEKKTANSTDAEKEKSEDSDSRSSTTDNNKMYNDNFLGCMQKIRHGYRDHVQEIKDQESGTNVTMEQVPTAISPSLPNETPVLKPPPQTTILIQEDRPGSGGVADLVEGTVSSIGLQADLIEMVGPTWLAEVLLRNQIPPKEIVKVAFILEPLQGSGLPNIASDGNNRLNANRMLRARKVLSYIAERIEAPPVKIDGSAWMPEEYLELYCQNQLVSPTMTLATIRTHVWKGGGDVLLYYTTNDKKKIGEVPSSTHDAQQSYSSQDAAHSETDQTNNATVDNEKDE